MKFKNINIIKLTLVIGLSVLVAGSVAYGAFKSVKSSPLKYEITFNKTFVNPIENDVSLEDRIVSYGMEFLETPYVTAISSKMVSIAPDLCTLYIIISKFRFHTVLRSFKILAEKSQFPI